MTDAADPLTLFDAWFAEASASEPSNREAMAVATATPDGCPSVRMLLLKKHGPEGFTFYSHDDSRKGEEIAANPNLALLFYWKSLGRQVRIEGRAHKVGAAEADAYFASRERDAQIGAWASDQSRPYEDPQVFERRFAEMKRRFEGVEVPRPADWCGYRVEPQRIEFWSEGPHRLHHRRLFRRTMNGWTEELLYP